MKIAVGSAFRNASGTHIERYFAQVKALAYALRADGHFIHVIAVEGDNTDSTAIEIHHALKSIPGQRVTHNHGGPVFGSTEHPARFAALKGVGDAILKNVPNDADVLFYVESDLIWDTPTAKSLIYDVAQLDDVDVLSPLTMAGEAFYDTFAFRGLDGLRWTPFSPYHSEARHDAQLTRMGSVGSCLAMKAAVARACEIGTTDGLVGFCAEARQKNFQIWSDTARKVRHP